MFASSPAARHSSQRPRWVHHTPADITYILLHSSCLDTSVPFYLIRSTVQSVQLTNIHPLPCMPLPAIEETLHHSSPLFYYQSSKRHGLPPEPFPKRPAITRTTTLRMPGCTHVGHTHPPPYDNDSVKPRPRLEGYSSSTRQMNIITQQRCWLAQGSLSHQEAQSYRYHLTPLARQARN